MQMLTCLSCKVVCHCRSIQQVDIVIALVHIVQASGLALLANIQLGRALEGRFVVLHVRIALLTGNIYQKVLKYRGIVSD